MDLKDVLQLTGIVSGFGFLLLGLVNFISKTAVVIDIPLTSAEGYIFLVTGIILVSWSFYSVYRNSKGEQDLSIWDLIEDFILDVLAGI